MRYWDASAVVPLLIRHAQTKVVSALRADDPVMSVWWGTVIECSSAMARLLRDGMIQRRDAAVGLERLREFEAEWVEMGPGMAVRDGACRLLRAHPLRAADALQLAAAIRLSEKIGAPVEIVCFDSRLADAVRAERLRVVDRAKR
jgi:predicted nucleic acid-binding protein